MQTMRVIARVANFPDPDAFHAMVNRMLPVGVAVEVRKDMQLVLKGLKSGELDPADEPTAAKAGSKEVMERWLKLKVAEASKKPAAAPAVAKDGEK